MDEKEAETNVSLHTKNKELLMKTDTPGEDLQQVLEDSLCHVDYGAARARPNSCRIFYSTCMDKMSNRAKKSSDQMEVQLVISLNIRLVLIL